ncbi:MAG: hypothetical protein JWO31_2985, partial [Phycisphaerales bacterium]|nr:hypothetical protein [Phycisphaerales bacterium]
VTGLTAMATPTGNRLVSAGADGRVRLWTLPLGLELRSFGSPDARVVKLAVEPAAGWVAAAEEDGTIRLWDPSRPSAAAVWAVRGGGGAVGGWASDGAGGAAEPTHLLFADGGKTLACCADSRVALVRCPAGQPVQVVDGRVGAITAVAASPAARHLCVGGASGGLALVRAADGVVLRTLDGHPAAVTAAAASPDGHLLLTGAADGTVRLWGLPDGQLLAALRAGGGGSDGDGGSGGPGAAVRFLAFAPDGGRAYVRCGDGPIRPVELAAWRLARTPLAHLTVADLARLQASPSRRTAFVAALLARRFEHDVVVEDVTPARIVAGAFTSSWGEGDAPLPRGTGLQPVPCVFARFAPLRSPTVNGLNPLRLRCVRVRTPGLQTPATGDVLPADAPLCPA